MVSLTISSLLVVLIGTVFLVQSQVYGRQLQRSQAHDNVRMLTEAVGAELRSTVPGGVTTARADSLTVRTPMAIAAVCGRTGTYAYVQSEGGAGAVDASELVGFAVVDPPTEDWSFYTVGWSTISAGTTDAATACFANGADTVGAYGEFLRLEALENYHDSIPPVGSLVMLYRETTFRFRTSVMDPTTRALFRRVSGATAQEYVTGLDASAAFSYRRNGRSGYQNQVGEGLQSTIDAVRIVAQSRQPSASGALDDFTFGWTVSIPLRNVR